MTDVGTPPRGRWRPIYSARVIAVVLFTFGAFSLIIGCGDIWLAQSFGVMLSGTFFLFVGVLQLAGAVAVLSFRSRDDMWRGILALVASGSAVLVGGIMLVMQLKSRELDVRMLVWLALVVAALLSFRRLWQAGVRVQPTGGWAAILSLSVLLTLLQFSYSDLYVPSQEPHNLNITAKFDRIEHNDQKGKLAVPVTIGLRNTSNSRVTILSSRYSAAGIRATVPRHGGTSGAPMRRAVQEQLPISQFYEPSGYTLIQGDRIFRRQVTLEPGEAMTRRIIVYVPIAAGFDLLTIHTGAIIVNRDRMRLYNTPRPRFSWDRRHPEARWNGQRPAWIRSDTDFTIETHPVGETSFTRFLTRRPRTLVIAWRLGQPTTSDQDGQDAAWALTRRGREYMPPDKGTLTLARRRYGVTTTYGTQEISLWKATAEAATMQKADSKRRLPFAG
jgi:hypothetical protein